MTKQDIDQRIVLAALSLVCLMITQAEAITFGQIDDFQDGSTLGWGGSTTTNVPDAGPHGVGDNALHVASASRFVTRNGSATDPNDGQASQWKGNWTSEGVNRIAMDVRNPNDFDLVLWLGIVGQGGADIGGSNDAYVTTTSMTVPGDDLWHTISIDVTVDDFIATGVVDDVAAAHQDVSQFRIIHNPMQAFTGAMSGGEMFVDNIRAIPEPHSLVLAVVGALVLIQYRSRFSPCPVLRGSRKVALVSRPCHLMTPNCRRGNPVPLC